MNPPARFLSIDLFKTLGISYLIILHQIVWFFTYGDGLGIRFDEVAMAGKFFGYKTGLHVLGFQIPLLAGITFYLSVQRKQLGFLEVMKRALFLVLLGFMMNLLAWGWGNFFDWDVLQFIGLSMVMCYPFVKNPSALKLVTLGLLGIGTFLLSNQFPLPQYGNSYWYIVFVGDKMGESYWPLCPWFFIFIVGIIVGKSYFEEKKNWALFSAIGVFYIILALVDRHFLPTISPDHIWGAELFKPSPFFILGIVGFSLAAIPLTENFVERFNRSAYLEKIPFLVLGREVLWVYLFSTVFGYKLTEMCVSLLDLNYKQTVCAFFTILAMNFICSYYAAQFMFRLQTKKQGVHT
jgi:hypothetical protein